MKSFDLTNKQQAVIAIAISQFAGQLQQDPNAYSVVMICQEILNKIGKVDQSVVNSLGGDTYEQPSGEVQPINK